MLVFFCAFSLALWFGFRHCDHHPGRVGSYRFIFSARVLRSKGPFFASLSYCFAPISIAFRPWGPKTRFVLFRCFSASETQIWPGDLRVVAVAAFLFVLVFLFMFSMMCFCCEAKEFHIFCTLFLPLLSLTGPSLRLDEASRLALRPSLCASCDADFVFRVFLFCFWFLFCVAKGLLPFVVGWFAFLFFIMTL